MPLNRENIVYSAFTTFREKSSIPSAEASRQGGVYLSVISGLDK